MERPAPHQGKLPLSSATLSKSWLFSNEHESFSPSSFSENDLSFPLQPAEETLCPSQEILWNHEETFSLTSQKQQWLVKLHLEITCSEGQKGNAGKTPVGVKLHTGFTVARHAASAQHSMAQHSTAQNPRKHTPRETSARASYSKPATCMNIEKQRTSKKLQS